MNLPRNFLILSLMLICLGLCCSACDPESLPVPELAPGFTTQAWIDAPLDGARIPLATYEIVFHAASPLGLEQVELAINGQRVTVLDLAERPYFFQDRFDWLPPAPGTYLLEVRAAAGGSFGLPAYARIEVGGAEQPAANPITPTPTATATATGTPTPSPSLTPTSAVEERACRVTALANLFCRQGPGRAFEPLDSFTPGLSADVVGRSTDGFFWYVIGPNFGHLCTVPDNPQLVELRGACSQLPRFTPIPSPTATATPTATPTATDTPRR